MAPYNYTLLKNIYYIKLFFTIATKNAANPLEALVPGFNFKTSIPKKHANVINIKYKQPANDIYIQYSFAPNIFK